MHFIAGDHRDKVVCTSTWTYSKKKGRIMNIPTAKYHAKTLSGFEELVAEELKCHGATEIVIGRRGVDFVATAEAMYRHCMHARFTLRVLRVIHTFKAKNTDDLYRLSARFSWEDIIKQDVVLLSMQLLTQDLYSR